MSKAAELANLIGNINAGGGGTNKNLIINGNCAVSQRGTVSSQSNDHYSAIDRFEIQVGSSGAVTSTQSTTVPTGEGFNNSLKVDVVTNNGGSEDASDYLLIMQKIEGLNLQQLKYGTSSAVPLACSFYVRSNLTGTFQFQIEVPDSGSYKYYGKTYTIDSANTWEKKTINIIANTNSSAIPDDNTEGLRVQWQLVGGSNYSSGTYTDGAWHGTGANRLSSSVNNTFARSTDNEFLLTGVQLEVGQNPTEFEHEPFDVTLRKCNRYFEKVEVTAGSYAHVAYAYTTTGMRAVFPYEKKRANPSFSFDNQGDVVIFYSGSNTDADPSWNYHDAGPNSCRVSITLTGVSTTGGYAVAAYVNGSVTYNIKVDAEL
jgi:hypothetical protein